MAAVKSKKKDFGKADPNHLMAIIEDFNDKTRVTNEVNQNLNSLTREFRGFREEMVGFKRETESSFKTLFHMLSQADLIELQERVEKIEKKLEMR